METLMITTICIILFWHRFLKKKGGAVSNPPKHLCASKKRHLFLRHLVRHHLAGPISQKVILLQEQVHKDLSCKGAPWNCALCYTESFKESPTKSSTEWKGSGLPTSETLCKESTVWVVAFGNFKRWKNTSNVWYGEFGLCRLQWLKMLSHEHE